MRLAIYINGVSIKKYPGPSSPKAYVPEFLKISEKVKKSGNEIVYNFLGTFFSIFFQIKIGKNQKRDKYKDIRITICIPNIDNQIIFMKKYKKILKYKRNKFFLFGFKYFMI
jgi:hypothetical protein